VWAVERPFTTGCNGSKGLFRRPGLIGANGQKLSVDGVYDFGRKGDTHSWPLHPTVKRSGLGRRGCRMPCSSLIALFRRPPVCGGSAHRASARCSLVNHGAYCRYRTTSRVASSTSAPNASSERLSEWCKTAVCVSASIDVTHTNAASPRSTVRNSSQWASR